MYLAAFVLSLPFAFAQVCLPRLPHAPGSSRLSGPGILPAVPRPHRRLLKLHRAQQQHPTKTQSCTRQAIRSFHPGMASPLLPYAALTPLATQIWMENTDFETAASSPTFTALAKQGVILNQYSAVTHPSQPNYVATVGGDFWGLADDAFYNIPPKLVSPLPRRFLLIIL